MKREADRLLALVEEVSRALFKRRHRLTVFAAVAFAAGDVHYAREVAARLGVADNQISPEFDALRTLGALQEIETSDRERWHHRVDHPIWDFTRNTVGTLATRMSPSAPDALVSDFTASVLGLEQSTTTSG